MNLNNQVYSATSNVVQVTGLRYTAFELSNVSEDDIEIQDLLQLP